MFEQNNLSYLDYFKKTRENIDFRNKIKTFRCIKSITRYLFNLIDTKLAINTAYFLIILYVLLECKFRFSITNKYIPLSKNEKSMLLFEGFS